jgi:hypothetical protein
MKMVLNGTHEFSDVTLPDGTPAEEITAAERAAFVKDYKETMLDVLKKIGQIPVRVAGNIRWCKVKNV